VQSITKRTCVCRRKIRRKEEEEEEEEEQQQQQQQQEKLECGPMPNVMAAQLNTGGALCTTSQSLADACCWSEVQ